MLVGNNLRSLEISEGKASEREDTYQAKLNELSDKFQDVSLLLHFPVNISVDYVCFCLI